MRERLVASVSGGATSMYMARRLQTERPDLDVLYLFANTGQEHPRTLVFIRQCMAAWRLPVVWIEAQMHPRGKGPTAVVVDPAQADQTGVVFEAMIAKYGIPNPNYPHCTRALKLHPMKNYLQSIGWGRVPNAVGIRADEPKRLSKKPGVVYPLADWWPTDKQDVIAWWEEQPFQLGLAEREGNCLWCWKKSRKKHLLNIQSNPEWYDFPKRMEAQHGYTNRNDRQVFFREGVSTELLFELAKVASADERSVPREEEDGGCTESCEAVLCDEISELI